MKQLYTFYLNLRYFLFLIKLIYMTSNFSMDSLGSQDKKNIKNIYVQKINSLMKLSKDTLLREDFQSSNIQEKRKMKKISSQIDRSTLKLEKNRESAKKARLRKKIYIKMLQSQIQCFKRLKTQGDQLNEQSQVFLRNKNTKLKDIQMDELIQHDVNVDKFLSGSDLGEVLKIQNKQFEKKLKQRDGVVEELYQLSTSGLVKKLKGAKNLQVFRPVLKKQARQNMGSFQNLIRRISHYYDAIKNSFRRIHGLTQKSKELRRNCREQGLQSYQVNKFALDLVSVSEFMSKLDLSRECQYAQQGQNKKMVDQNVECQGVSPSTAALWSDLNLHSTQRLLIRSQKFFQHTSFEEQE